tara:strand:+ start:410 stop:871 length:462 start_codon:yes stop_codon:yes gene_type:complete
MWFSGSGVETELELIMQHILHHNGKNGRVFIGCDSQISKDSCVFSTVICLHGADDQKGGFYFFKREKEKKKSYPTIVSRLIKEVELSIQMGFKITKKMPATNIEIHIDANSRKEQPTTRFADMLMGYAKGAGFDCKIKPDAWASNSIADKHSK